MDMNSLSVGPFNEGFIRIATSIDSESRAVRFHGAMEVLARHHERPEANPTGTTPCLAKHSMAGELVEKVGKNKLASAIVEIPIRMFFNKAVNSLSVKYQAYDESGKPVCIGDGCSAMRTATPEASGPVTVKTPCLGPDTCEYANSGEATCRRQVKMPVQIKDQENPFSVFEVRTSSYNAYKALRSQLALIESRFQGLRHVPLKLSLWKASNEASNFEAFDLFKLQLDATSEIDAMREVQRARKDELECGLISDHDNAFEKLLAATKGQLAFDDFTDVRDFYTQAVSPQKGRRKGTNSLAQEIRKTGKKGAGTSFAADLISSSLKSAANGTQTGQNQ